MFIRSPWHLYQVMEILKHDGKGGIATPKGLEVYRMLGDLSSHLSKDFQ